MNNEILRIMGFDKEVDAMYEGRCPLCDQIIELDVLKEAEQRYMNEYEVTGICKPCQDEVFKDTYE